MRDQLEAARSQPLYEQELFRLNQRFPLIIPQYIDQYAAHMLTADREGFSLAQKAAAVRDAGRQCTVEEKKAFGVSPRQKLGWDFARSVTPLALTNPLEAGRAIANAGNKAAERLIHKALCLADRVPARMLIRDDDRTCAAAKHYMAAIIPVREVPEFPLPRCDKWTCRCSFNRYAEWMGGRFI
jgi:hypothetical protein